MLTPLKESDFDTYAEWAYALALDLTRSGYPTYTDGIKTKAQFMEQARAAFARENEDILLYMREGRVCGWVHYFHLPEDQYLDTASFCISEGMGDAVAEFIAFAREHFPGSGLYLGFPKENTEAVAALEAGGYPRIEESWNDVMDLSRYTPGPDCPDIVPVTRENYGLFRQLHDRQTGLYWNSDRLLAALDKWTVCLYLRDGAPAGAIYSLAGPGLSEIFGVDFPGEYDGEAYRLLVTAALNRAKRHQETHMVFFNDDAAQADALKLGFHCVSGYVCYHVKL